MYYSEKKNPQSIDLLKECPVTPIGRSGRLHCDLLLGMKSSIEVDESDAPPEITKTRRLSLDKLDRILYYTVKQHGTDVRLQG